MRDASSSFQTRLAETARLIEATAEGLLSDACQTDETVRPARLTAAMRHAVLGGGKRLRPYLLMESARLFGLDGAGVARVATALEFVHCYSLVHDDLPSMDDDDLRRGQPTVHRAYDEATAILAGDALLTYAFEVIADPLSHADPVVRADLVLRLARAAGLGGMVGGQVLDLAAEGRWSVDGAPLGLSDAEIRRLQAMKTGALIRFPCEVGAVMAGASVADVARLGRFGAIIGLAFQIADDVLDVEASTEAMGKATGKDAARGKGTLVGLHGLEPMKAELARLVAAAASELAPFGEEAGGLLEAARFIAQRRS